MKRITQKIMLLASFMFLASGAFAQSTINFETVGQDWAWTIFENGDNAPALYSVVANPAVGGINTSANVAKYIVNANGQPWAGAWSNNLPDFTFTSENCIVKVMVYKDVISDFLVKFENDDVSVAFEKKVSNTVTNQWEELTFDFTNRIGTAVTRLVIIPDFPAARTAGSTNYFDNISFNAGTPPVSNNPTTASPLPTIQASKVISLFSRAYTNVGVDTWRTSWSNAGYSEAQVAGTTVKKYDNLVFVGIETTGANLINATGMTHFHVDVWTPDMTTFRVKLVDFGANAVWSGGDDVEHELTYSPTLSSWVSLDIPLADFTGLVTKAHIAQLIFSGTPTGTVYVDNVYFYNSATTSNNELQAQTLTVFPNPVADVLNVRSANELVKMEITNLVGQSMQQVNLKGFEASVSVSELAVGNYFVTLTTEDGKVSTHKFVKR
ncbi:MAG: T9SS type A sorting domain-containing protein [Paludibacter sp.]|nr:T9SS type A sorting domain-containing protein [Paludibacter sp.]